jgi:hypothetical protein
MAIRYRSAAYINGGPDRRTVSQKPLYAAAAVDSGAIPGTD